MAENTTRDGNFVPGGSLGIIEQLDLTTKFPQTVAILDGDGNQITSFGGGTQYTEGATPPADPSGPTLLFEDTGVWKAISATNPLPVLATIDTTGLATSDNQTNASQKTQLVDSGGVGVSVLDLNVNNALATALVDANGDQITALGGTQYVNGDTVATPTGTVAMWRQSADNTVQSVADDNPMPVNVATNTGLATSTKQDSQITLETELNALTETLQELVQRLMPLAGAISSTAALRVAPISSVSTAVTGSVTATGPITSAQSIAEKAVAGVLYPEKIALTNTASVLSNINNCVAA